MPLANLFQSMAVRLNGPRADGVRLALNLEFTDLDRRWLLIIDNSVLHAHPDKRAEYPDAELTVSSLDFKRLMMGLTNAAELIGADRLAVNGQLEALVQLGSLFDAFERRFPIVTPIVTPSLEPRVPDPGAPAS